MKYTYLLLSCLIYLQACNTQPSTPKAADYFQQKRVLFLGNSITHQGTYVSFIDYFLQEQYPEWETDIISIGLGSETVSCLTEPDHPFPRPCLKARLDQALREIKPDVVVACYGMNDGIYHPPKPERLQAYQQGIEDLRTAVSAVSASLILITPPPFDPLPIKERLVGIEAPEFGYKTPYEGYDEVLGEYGKWLLSLSSKDLPVIDWHSEMNQALYNKRKIHAKATFANDGIHPSAEGHLLMAKIFLEKFEINIPDSLDEKTLLADKAFQYIDVRRRKRSMSWLNYVGYTRGKTVKTISPKPLLVLMGGQSNMVGSGKKEDIDQQASLIPSHISYINFGYTAGLKQQSATTFGPEIGISQALSKVFPDQPFILLKYAVGGASLLDWAPNYSKEKAEITGNARFGNLYEKFFRQIDSVMALYEPLPIALLWMQGERDARIPEAGKDYAKNMEALISAFRKRIGHQQLPFIMGVVNPPSERYQAASTVQQAQREIAQKLPEVYAFETEGLEKWKDNLHYNSQGQLDLGERYGEILIEVLNKEF